LSLTQNKIAVNKNLKKTQFFLKLSENQYVDTKPSKIEGYTASQLAELTGKTRHAVESWLSLHKIKPLSEALYPADTIDKIRAARRGRPRKAGPGEADSLAKSAKKPNK
jgi:hypothetical protein